MLVDVGVFLNAWSANARTCAWLVELTNCWDRGIFFSDILWTAAEAEPAARAAAMSVDFILMVTEKDEVR